MRYIKLFENGYLNNPPYKKISFRRFKIMMDDNTPEKISFVEDRLFNDLCSDSRLEKYLEPNGCVFFDSQIIIDDIRFSPSDLLYGDDSLVNVISYDFGFWFIDIDN